MPDRSSATNEGRAAKWRLMARGLFLDLWFAHVLFLVTVGQLLWQNDVAGLKVSAAVWSLLLLVYAAGWMKGHDDARL